MRLKHDETSTYAAQPHLQPHQIYLAVLTAKERVSKSLAQSFESSHVQIQRLLDLIYRLPRLLGREMRKPENTENLTSIHSSTTREESALITFRPRDKENVLASYRHCFRSITLVNSPGKM